MANYQITETKHHQTKSTNTTGFNKISNLMSKISWAFNKQDWEIKKLRTHAQFSTDLLIYIKYSYLKNMN